MFWLGALIGFLIGLGCGMLIWHRLIEGMYELEHRDGIGF